MAQERVGWLAGPDGGSSDPGWNLTQHPNQSTVAPTIQYLLDPRGKHRIGTSAAVVVVIMGISRKTCTKDTAMVGKKML